MDFSERYRVIAARDRRFDGQFVMAVRTTGIYCRPSCPARTPKPGNVEFFPTSAAAHLAGYRACRRCLPEATPGSPEWNLREGVAARVMRLISEGVVEREGVGGLARRVGYSERQLHRVLVEELGAGPLALARAQRAHNARQLIVSTTMRFSDVAFAAGFSSIRQFNETIAEVFGVTPSELRRRSHLRERMNQDQAGSVRITLAHREPIDKRGLFSWFAARSIDGIESACSRSYGRSLRLANRATTVEVEDTGRRLEAVVRVGGLSDMPTLFGRVRRLFDLDADPLAVDAALGADPRLVSSVIANQGIRIPGVLDPHEALVRAIIGQGGTRRSARAQIQRLVDELGDELPDSFHDVADGRKDRPGITKLFPTPATIASHAHSIVRGPTAKTDTLVRVCEALADGSLQIDIADTREAMTKRLRSVKGIGPWTADYLALRVLGHPDVLIAGDAAALKGARFLGIGTNIRQVTERAAQFAPWRGYLTVHLWRAAQQAAQNP